MPAVDIDYFLEEQNGPKVESSNSLVPAYTEPQHEEAVFEEVKPEEPVNPIPAALRGIDLTKTIDRRTLIIGLTKNLPVNEFNLPIYLYRPDLIDITVAQTSSIDEDYAPLTEMLRNAEVPLDYSEGFPAIESGTPIWGRLPFEEDIAFNAFLQYLDQPGTRMISLLDSYPPEDIRSWPALNYWQTRALAYDMYKVVHHHRLREHRILKLNDRHYIEAEKAFDKLAKALGDKLNDQEALKEMTPNEMIKAMESVVKIQRMAAGLSTTGQPKEENRSTTNVEVAMREVSQTSTPQIVHDDNLDMSTLLNDPKLLEKAQEVVIRVTNNNQ